MTFIWLFGGRAETRWNWTLHPFFSKPTRANLLFKSRFFPKLAGWWITFSVIIIECWWWWWWIIYVCLSVLSIVRAHWQQRNFISYVDLHIPSKNILFWQSKNSRIFQLSIIRELSIISSHHHQFHRQDNNIQTQTQKTEMMMMMMMMMELLEKSDHHHLIYVSTLGNLESGPGLLVI